MRIIAHLDMDAFFAAVEERDHPRYKGRPIVVGADPEDGKGRGVVSTANYAARKYGIHSAMPISIAWRLAEKAREAGLPATTFVGGHFSKYSETSDRIIAIVKKYVPLVEQASVDEAYLDLTPPVIASPESNALDSGRGNLNPWQQAEEIARKIKSEIKKKEKLTCSVGIGPNKLIAKIAAGTQKPDGFTVVHEKDAEKFLEPLPIRSIPGIGPKTESIFTDLGVKIIKDLKKYSRVELQEMLGKWGIELYDRIRGIDDSLVVEKYEAKSIGEQITFHEDTLDTRFISENLKELCNSVISRFMKSDFQSFRTIGITVRFEDFLTKTRAHTFPESKNKVGNLFERQSPKKLAELLYFEAFRLLAPFFDKRENPKRKKIRLIGIRIEKLS